MRAGGWRRRLEATFYFTPDSFQPFSSISYMATGGISHRIPMPLLIYRLLFQLDLALSRMSNFSLSRFGILGSASRADLGKVGS
jgi:hypothetical protein